jgi:arginase
MLETSNGPTVIAGGDHSISIGSISAVNDHCMVRSEHLGVLWCDAHADFNTPETSPSGNLHGMPVAVLCNHAPFTSFGAGLNTHQFAYWGVRDVDDLEEKRMQHHGMLVLDTITEVMQWTKRFDRIHVSFDVDCLDPQIAPGVSTPVPGGVDYHTMEKLFQSLKETGKILSIDCVELNPSKDKNGYTADVAAQLVEKLLW